jgi:hypothetical protein
MRRLLMPRFLLLLALAFVGSACAHGRAWTVTGGYCLGGSCYLGLERDGEGRMDEGSGTRVDLVIEVSEHDYSKYRVGDRFRGRLPQERTEKHSPPQQHTPAFVVLWQGYDDKGNDHLHAEAFATTEEIEAWLNGCETEVMEEAGETFTQESCSLKLLPGTDTGTLIGIYELGRSIAGGFELTGPSDPEKDDYNPRWRLR